MSWETMSDIRETAICACGKGTVIRWVRNEGDDWNRFSSSVHDEEVLCRKCGSMYHLEHVTKTFRCMPWDGDGIVDKSYLVPNGRSLNINLEPVSLPFEVFRKFPERIVARYTKQELQAIVEDMKINKFSTRLTLDTSKDVVSEYHKSYRSRKLTNIIDVLSGCINNYESFVWTYPRVQQYREQEAETIRKNKTEFDETLAVSFELHFK